jgi:hypothetical protein
VENLVASKGREKKMKANTLLTDGSRGLRETAIRICDWCGEKEPDSKCEYWKSWEKWDFCTGRCRAEFVRFDPEFLMKVEEVGK